ncbi:DUF6378 domain-containing protein [Mannheimia pernigra]|uniref:DUF6378 domain-containing protein n=1 Tax=Mannheimia pernigra TaxID=111844 RepID=UPI0013196CB6|nr:DUF6378 domain-containing protein [Mannheimia pernigra]QHB17900.1 hypothetical protein GM695_07615 [Mannheimia pernigra]
MREWEKQMPFSANLPNLHIRPAGKFEVKNVSIEKIIEERGKNYGSFDDVATMSQQLKAVLLDTNTQLKPHHKEAGEMICVKLARIFAGCNPDYKDNWRDIAGYAVLGGRLEGE